MEPLPWEIRQKIAIGAARRLDFLHISEKSIFYRGVKLANILLNRSYTAFLEGLIFFLERVTGHLYLKSDADCFGAVLLELLTRPKARDNTRPSFQVNLVELANLYLNEKNQIEKITDSKA
ncbi:hypothetical protein MLD38_024847 [Melastoma candidum]|uniref:Uncharacterized protein n=1 Tax=Melastoma candidum TaxID=119954 RepID=A0ACB9P0D8_9MYRT|nr:hypothetical protein MLD38_024847 [Melastoma candidum]